MNFKPTTATNGSHLQGYVDVSYQRLVEVFGPPHSEGDAYKSDAQWSLEFEDGTIATIYNYKDGKNYNGRTGTPSTWITEWHVGGFTPKALELVLGELKTFVEPAEQRKDDNRPTWRQP